MAPKVLVSDKLSSTAVQIFRDRGIEVDFEPDLGKDKNRLREVIGQYDGLAIRSATKVTKKILDAADNLKVVGRAGIGVDNVDRNAASKKGVSTRGGRSFFGVCYIVKDTDTQSQNTHTKDPGVVPWGDLGAVGALRQA